ncbi:hypothetical protein SAMN05660464_3435 [Geodermatophilus dictyosporus]|uniref:Uncharacterized protein n=1 Tax=Geodermatophilus dictyosporus TaxID=1523247 RepID=A0A1I5R212_9ACTN|nr:hypothetical protein [Geodermatophilus dictyosporus]SFP52525.1 hypothetical protein SAMN05660464_3435 [Geodermatophilus dictyosporus]
MRLPKNAWKLLGLAGVAGVAATGAVLVRGERQRRAYTPDDVRARLHERHAAASTAATTSAGKPGDGPPGPVPVPARRWWRPSRRRR